LNKSKRAMDIVDEVQTHSCFSDTGNDILDNVSGDVEINYNIDFVEIFLSSVQMVTLVISIVYDLVDYGDDEDGEGAETPRRSRKRSKQKRRTSEGSHTTGRDGDDEETGEAEMARLSYEKHKQKRGPPEGSFQAGGNIMIENQIVGVQSEDLVTYSPPPPRLSSLSDPTNNGESKISVNPRHLRE